MAETDTPDVLELFDEVKAHRDYVFGTVFVRQDFPGENVPAGFSARHATDALAEAGNEYIELTVGPLTEKDFDRASAADDEIFDLLDRVRSHLDYGFGTIFVAADFPGGMTPKGFDSAHAVDALARAGSEYIYLTVGEPDGEA
jgi:hypothetical protein